MTREMWASEIAKELWYKYGRSTLKRWDHPWHLEVWLRDDCCCVYCGRDMLRDRGITYFLYTYDHLLPRTGHPALQDAIWNKVLACKSCNVFKQTFDPSSDGIPATKERRDELIERARAYIRKQVEPAETLFAQEREILNIALREHEARRGTSA